MKILGYQQKNYKHFKQCVDLAVAILQSEGKKIYTAKWSRKSPYQKARYKDEYVFPEVWVYVKGGTSGILVNGEDVDGDYRKLLQYLRDLI